jgi:predicted DNA-binding transcriptional regulator AlpA
MDAASVSRRFYSERDLAAVLGVSTKTIQGWRLRGKGPPWKKLCGSVRYDVQACDAWTAAQPGGGGTA